MISDGQGRCFTSSRIYEQNSQLSQAEVDQIMRLELGCRSLSVLEPLADDVTFHIDLFAKLVNLKTFIVGDFVDHKVNQERMNRNVEKLQRLGYKVHRLKVRSPVARVYLTHLNSFLLNGTVLLPSYGVPEDLEAAKLYQSLGFQIIQFPAQDLVLQGGSIHCVMRSLPN